MSGDSRRESHAPVAIERLFELIPEIDSDLDAVREFVNACFAGEHSDLSRLEAFDGDFYVGQLYDRIDLAKGYFEQVGIGPDVEVLFRAAKTLRDDIRDYGKTLVRLADSAIQDADPEVDVLRASSNLHDKAIVLNLDTLAIEEAYGRVKDLFARLETASGLAGGAQTADQPGEPATSEESRTNRKKRSTEPGEARAKIIAALTAWHQYDKGSCGEYEPIGVRQFVREFSTVCSAAQFSGFLLREFGGHAKYRTACHNKQALRERLAILNGEVPARALKIREDYSPDRLPARRK